MQLMRLCSALAGLVAIGLSSGAALAQVLLCDRDVGTETDTLDDFIKSGWGCEPQDEILDMYYLFQFNQLGWYPDFGLTEPCNQSKPVFRTLNALQLLKYSHSNTSTPNCDGSGGNFLDWVYCWAGDAIAELDGRCYGDNVDDNAHTSFGTTELYMPVFYDSDVLERASTIVHEAKHAEDSCSHEEPPCCLNGASCDSDFWNGCHGVFESGPGTNAFQINFLTWYARTADWPTETAETVGTLGLLKSVAVGGANDLLKTRFCTDPCFLLDSTGRPYHTCFQDDWHGNDPGEQTGDDYMPFASGTSVAGYATTTPPAQHVVFVGTDAHVHELLFTDHWQHNDLMNQPDTLDAPPAAFGSSLAGYVVSRTSLQQQHIVYISADGHVNELMYDSAWHWKDLTQDSGAPPAVATSPLTGYETTYGTGQHHINFIDAVKGHVYELFIDVGDTHWHPPNDLTDIALKDDGTKPPPPRANSPLTGYQTAWNSAQHVNFIDADHGFVWELYFTTSWHALNLTANALTAFPHATSTLTAYTTDINGNQQHVVFIDVQNHVRELYFTGSLPWLSADLNQQAGIPNVVAAPWALHGYMTTYTWAHQQHVVFVSASDGHIGELYFDQNTLWRARDLSDVAVPKATLPKVGSQLTGYQTTWDSSQHVNFIDTNARISELYRVR